jgi:hypothetical protein
MLYAVRWGYTPVECHGLRRSRDEADAQVLLHEQQLTFGGSTVRRFDQPSAKPFGFIGGEARLLPRPAIAPVGHLARHIKPTGVIVELEADEVDLDGS